MTTLPDITVNNAVRVGSATTWIDGAPDVLERARGAFNSGQALVLPSAFDPAFLETILAICRSGPYAPEHIGRIGWRTIEQQDVAGRALRFAMERASFLRWIAAAAGCDALGHVIGVVAEMAPGTDQQLDWHDDRNDGGHRRLAMTIHLSDRAYDGGLFEMEETDTKRLLVREGALPPGTIVLFRIGSGLRHRVMPVTGGGPRRAFTGWITV